MTCLSDEKIQNIVENNTEDKEQFLHLKQCENCTKKLNRFKLLEDTLEKSFFVEPPASITEFVMAKILSKKPSLQSVLLSILISLSSIVLLVFTYYGFAKDSLVKGANALGNILLNGLHSLVLFLSGVFEYCIIFMKTINKFTKIILGIGADFELIGLVFVVMLTGIFFTFYKFALKFKMQKGV